MSRTARVAGGLLAAAVLAACGGDPQPRAKAAPGGHEPAASGAAQALGGAPAAGASGSAAPGGTGTAVTTPAAGTGAVPATAAPGAPGAAPGGASPSTAPSPTQIVLNATLAKTCVRPGETQTLTVKARPHMKVIVNTGYADRQEGSVHGGRFTHDQHTDGTGLYTVSWTVALTAPHGEAATSVAAVDRTGTGHRRIPFRVAAAC